MENAEGKDGKCCCCPCHKAIGIFIVLFGLTVLLGTLGVFSAKVMWIIASVLIILTGLKKLFGRMCRCCSKDAKCCEPEKK